MILTIRKKKHQENFYQSRSVRRDYISLSFIKLIYTNGQIPNSFSYIFQYCVVKLSVKRRFVGCSCRHGLHASSIRRLTLGFGSQVVSRR